MPNLYEILADAQHGAALADIGRAYGLSPEQTDAAVSALLPAISMGLKQSTATPEGLGNLLALMATRPEFYAMYEDPNAAFSEEGRAAGNAALAAMFGSPDASRAITAQAQQLSGVTSTILKKLLPVIVGMILSGLLRSGSGKASPAPAPTPRAPEPAPDAGGALIDILKQIFGQGQSRGGPAEAPGGGGGGSPWGIPPIGDILGEEKGGAQTESRPAPKAPQPIPADEPAAPAPTDGGGGQSFPGGDILAQILKELEKQIREGKVKPVIVGPFEIDLGGGAQKGPSAPSQPQVPGGDILGQILREMLGGKGQAQSLGYGSALFGDRFEPGRDVDRSAVDSLQEIFDRFVGPQR